MKNYLKQERERKKYTQVAVAKLCEVSERTVKNWESGNPIPSDKLRLLGQVGFDVMLIIMGEKKYPDRLEQISELSDKVSELISHEYGEHKLLEGLTPTQRQEILSRSLEMKALNDLKERMARLEKTEEESDESSEK